MIFELSRVSHPCKPLMEAPSTKALEGEMCGSFLRKGQQASIASKRGKLMRSGEEGELARSQITGARQAMVDFSLYCQ